MKKVLIFVHIILLFTCYTVYLNQWISPTFFPYFQFVALGFPILFLLNILAIIAWVFIRPKLSLYALILSLGLVIPASKWYNFFGKESPQKSNLKVLSYNVKYFRTDGLKLWHWIEQEDPDIFLSQEHNQPFLEKNVQTNFPYVEHNNYVAIFSKYPIIETQEISNGIRGRSMYTDIKIKEDTIRVINLYLNSTRVKKEMVKESVSTDKFDAGTRKIKYRLQKSYKEHQQQIRAIAPYVKNSPYPVLLAGDFNSPPNSYEYFHLKKGLNDVFYKVGKGLGTTFHDFKFPLRIDFMFTSDRIKPVSYQIKRDIKYSDHFPTIGEFYLE